MATCHAYFILRKQNTHNIAYYCQNMHDSKGSVFLGHPLGYDNYVACSSEHKYYFVSMILLPVDGGSG